jgi:hypothetical protein
MRETSATYLTRLGECVVDIEEHYSVLDGTLVERSVYCDCGCHLEGMLLF